MMARLWVALVVALGAASALETSHVLFATDAQQFQGLAAALASVVSSSSGGNGVVAFTLPPVPPLRGKVGPRQLSLRVSPNGQQFQTFAAVEETKRRLRAEGEGREAERREPIGPDGRDGA